MSASILSVTPLTAAEAKAAHKASRSTHNSVRPGVKAKSKQVRKVDETKSVEVKVRLYNSSIHGGGEVTGVVTQVRVCRDTYCEGAVDLDVTVPEEEFSQIFQEALMFSKDNYGGWGVDPDTCPSEEGYEFAPTDEQIKELAAIADKILQQSQ